MSPCPTLLHHQQINAGTRNDLPDICSLQTRPHSVIQPTQLIHRYLERRPVILSAAKDLASLPKRSFAALRMTGRTPLTSARGKLISKCLTDTTDATDTNLMLHPHHWTGPALSRLHAAKDLAAHRDRPFAARKRERHSLHMALIQRTHVIQLIQLIQLIQRLHLIVNRNC